MLDLNNRFSQAPIGVNIGRSRFDRNSDLKTSMSAGLLYPVYIDEVLPGDTFSMDTTVFARMNTPIHPVMDDCYLDYMYFFVPNRLLWDHWKDFMGEPSDDPYATPTEYSIPAIKSAPGSGERKSTPSFRSVADYFGLPPGVPLPPQGVSALPFRAYALIWNEWFRPQTLAPAIEFTKGDDDVYLVGFGGNGAQGAPETLIYHDGISDSLYSRFYSTAAYGGYLAPVAKNFDYFTSALREPQNGDPVAIPLSGIAPVIPLDQTVDIGDGNTLYGGMTLSEYEGSVNFGTYDSPASGTVLNLTNSGADLSQLKNYSGILSNINDLRFAFQMQRFLEKDNYGTRYTEILRNHFGVSAPDASLQRPELLSARRIQININQVLQTSGTNEVSPQGNTAAYSSTLDVSNSFTKSFTEHGYVIGVACIRARHTYQNSVEKFWTRKDKLQFYFPTFAHIGNQPIYNHEIYSQGTDQDYEVFGFQPAWSDYRYKPSRISGEMRSSYPQSLDVWHYGDDYNSLPTLTTSWIWEPRQFIDRTLAVDSTLSDQFKVHFAFNLDTVRPMPVYSEPGLADHF